MVSISRACLRLGPCLRAVQPKPASLLRTASLKEVSSQYGLIARCRRAPCGCQGAVAGAAGGARVAVATRAAAHGSAWRRSAWRRMAAGATSAARGSTASAPSAAAADQAGGQSSGPVAVVAFGGNALLKRGEPLTTEAQLRNARLAAEAVRQLVGHGFRVCVTHGNGPQVGLLALQDPQARLEVLDAETEGQLGFILELEIGNALPGRQVAALLTQVVVDPADPAFSSPTKHVGPRYSQQEAEQLTADQGWSVAHDGDSFRRVVASPLPHDIVEWRAIQTLLQSGVITVCCGGGGIPVAEEGGSGRRYGVEAVVDKDEASALLGIKLQADWLLMLTDAAAIYDPSAWPEQERPLASPIRCSQLEGMPFASGSMAPKVAAACRFVRATGGRAAVGSIQDALRIVRGEAGTVVEAG